MDECKTVTQAVSRLMENDRTRTRYCCDRMHLDVSLVCLAAAAAPTG